MSNIVKIDGTDLATLGMFILKGGDYDLLSFPERKKPAQNDWFEHDGLDVDLSEVFFKEKTVMIKYCLIANNATELQQRLNGFENLHFKAGYRQLYIQAFNRTFELRTVEFTENKHTGGYVLNRKKIVEISVKYIMDNPVQYFQSTTDVPTLNRKHLSYISVNGHDLSKFGIIVQKAYDTILKIASPKTGITQKSSTQTGLTADTSYIPKKKSKKITIECVMVSGTLANFETNYTALFRQLTKTGEIQIGIQGATFNCYYDKMRNFEKKKPLTSGARVTFKLELIQI